MNGFVRCLIASALTVMGNILFNGVSNDAVAPILPVARDVSTVAGACMFVLLAFVAKYRPEVLAPRAFTVAAAVLTMVAHGIIAWGVAAASAPAIAFGMGLTGIAGAWCTVIWLLALSSLDLRHACLCLALAGCLGVAVAYGVQLPKSHVLAASANTVAAVLSLALTYPLAAGVFERLKRLGLPADYEISRPSTMLPFGHRLFVSIFAFGVAYGFGLCYGPAGYGSAADMGVIVAMLVVALLVVYQAKPPRIDVLFASSFGFVLLGFLVALVDDARLGMVVTVMLIVGYNLFELMMWSTLSTIASRNTVDAIPAVAWGTAAGYMGIFVGAQVGQAFVGIEGDRLPAMLALAVAVAALVVYMLRTSRGFGFDETIDAIEPEHSVVEVRYTDRLAETVQELVSRHDLTERESQVLLLLARGNNASRICEELCISRNTVKYHARNIYDKLGVHSQQEIVDLVSASAAVRA